MRDALLHVLGLAGGAANTARHRVQGYKHPRPFGAEEVDRAADHVSKVVERYERHVDFEGKRVLELGPGPDLGTGYALLARGAASYQAVDAFNLLSAQPALYQELESRFGSVDMDRLDYCLATFPSLPEIEGRFDVVVSNATLEHIEQIPALFRRLRELSDAMVHHVDAKAHMRWFRDHDPLNLYRYGDRVYGRILSFPGAPNRLLANDYLTAAVEAGFGASKIVPGRLATTVPRVAPRFRDRTDLRYLSFTLVA